MFADLHVRTVKSMGRVTPVEAVLLAEQRKLKAIAIVDHDTVRGVPEAANAGEFYGLEVVPGVELMYEFGPREVHIIGYFIDYHARPLLDEIDRLQGLKIQQIENMVKKLQKLKIDIDYEEVLEKAQKSTLIGRSNIAQVLVEKGVVKDYNAAFDKYLAQGAKAYVPKEHAAAKQTMQAIVDSGGVPALAHPNFNQAEEMIPELVKNGLKGLEVYHPSYTKEDTAKYERIAKKYNLIAVGGSDSEQKKSPVGTVTVPYKTVLDLRRLRK